MAEKGVEEQVLAMERLHFYTQNSPTELGLKDTVGDYYSK